MVRTTARPLGLRVTTYTAARLPDDGETSSIGEAPRGGPSPLWPILGVVAFVAVGGLVLVALWRST